MQIGKLLVAILLAASASMAEVVRTAGGSPTAAGGALSPATVTTTVPIEAAFEVDIYRIFPS